MPASTTNDNLVLVVDDEANMRDLLKDLLELYGFGVVTAECADIAYEILQKQRVCAVISDILMKGDSGVDLLIRTRQTCSDMPFIMISGFAGNHTEETVLAAGADALVKKPFHQTELLAALKKAIEKRSN